MSVETLKENNMVKQITRTQDHIQVKGICWNLNILVNTSEIFQLGNDFNKSFEDVFKIWKSDIK